MKLIKKVNNTIASLLSLAMISSMISTFPAFAEQSKSANFVYDDYSVSYNVTNSWGDTDVVNITLTNTGETPIENWMLYFEPNGEITSMWDVQTALTSNNITYFKNAGYNSTIAPNASVTFSYFVDNCESIPDSYTLCQKRVEKSESYNVEVVVDDSWGDGFNGTIIITNITDKPIEDWELIFDTNFTITKITSSWSGTMTALEPYSYMLKGSYTSVIKPNSSVRLGFSGVKDGTPVIINSMLTEVVADEELIEFKTQYPNGKNIELNTIYTSTFSAAGQVDKYYYTIPLNTSYGYVFETYGDTDTLVTVKQGSHTYSDDNSGTGLNAAVGFLGVDWVPDNRVLEITVTHAKNGTGTYSFHIRRQRAQIYTFEYDDVDTTGGVEIPYDYLNDYCNYHVLDRRNKKSSHILENDSSNLSRLNSEVIFFLGHGYTNGGGIAFSEGTGLYYDDLTSMDNTKIAVWTACYSSVAPEGQVSIGQSSVDHGAKSAIGWPVSINSASAIKFTNNLFKSLAGAKTLSEAAKEASDSILWPFDDIHDYAIFDDGSTTIQSPYNINSKKSPIKNINNNIIDYENFEYEEYIMPNGTKRYYKLIDNVISNDYYVTDSDGNIIYNSDADITKEEISETDKDDYFEKPISYNFSKKVKANGLTFDKLINTKSYDVYVKLNDELIPVRITYSEYTNSDNISYTDVVCINLKDNSLIDYEEIC